MKLQAPQMLQIQQMEQSEPRRRERRRLSERVWLVLFRAPHGRAWLPLDGTHLGPEAAACSMRREQMENPGNFYRVVEYMPVGGKL